MTSEGSHIWSPSNEGSSGKLPSSQGIIGRLFRSKVDKKNINQTHENKKEKQFEMHLIKRNNLILNLISSEKNWEFT